MAGAVVGLELGPGELRAAEVAGQSVRRFAAVETRAVDERGDIVDRAQLTADIRRLWKAGRFRARSVVVGLTSSSVATRPVEFPAVPVEHARSAARFEVEDLLSFGLDQAVVAVQLWPQPAEADSTRALVVAAPSSLVDDAVGAVVAAHLQAVDVRLAAASTATALAGQHEGAIAIVDVGASRSAVVICVDGVPLFVRQIAAGAEPGSSITEELEYELVRIQGFRHDGASALGTQPSPEDLRLAPLVEAIRTSIEFHLGQRDVAGIDRVVLAGTHRHAAGLVHRVAAVVALPVSVAGERTEGAQGDAAASLALTARSSDLSLLPAAVGEARRYRRALLVSVATAAVLGLGLYRVASAANGEIDDLQLQAESAERRYVATASALDGLSAVVEADRQAGVLRRDVARALEGDVDWRQLLAATTNAMPADSWLTAFRGQRSTPALGESAEDAAQIGDVSFSGVGIDQTTVGRWLLAAADVPGVLEPRLDQSTLAAIGPFGSDRVLFTVSADLDETAVSDRAARISAGQR
jgi:Tfp pilus assembly PilM family ATPase